MQLTDAQREFLTNNHAAAMITVGDDGVAKAVRIGVVMVDGRLQSSGNQGRVRTPRLRRDPRCTLFVFDTKGMYVTLETTVTILDGPDAPQLNLRLMREMQGRPTGPLQWYGKELDEPAFLEEMVRDQRLVYEFDVQRAYGAV